MRKKLLFAFVFAAITSQAQETLLSEGFDNLGDVFTMPTGWTGLNASSPVGTTTWFRGNPEVFAAYSGPTNGYIGANFNSTAGTGIISTWLMSPVLTLQNDDVISFYTRVPTASGYADNLELRLSMNGAASANPSGTTGLGDYTTLALTANPVFPVPSGYPDVWTQMSYTITGLNEPTDVRFAFRYTVPVSAGPNGNNSNYVGIDAVTVTRPTAGTSDFFKNNISMYPNPAKDVLNLTSLNAASITKVSIADLNGRVVNSVDFGTVSQAEIAVSALQSGVYTITIETTEGKGVSKFIKS